MSLMSRRSLFALLAGTPLVAIAAAAPAVAVARPAPPKVEPKKLAPLEDEDRIVHEAFLYAGLISADQCLSSSDVALGKSLLAQRPPNGWNACFWLAAQLAPIFRIPPEQVPFAVMRSAYQQELARHDQD